MRSNRSIPTATVIPVLSYPSVRDAVAWLGAAFGFIERVWLGEDHRAQLSVGDGAVIVADIGGNRRPPEATVITHSVMVRVADVQAQWERALREGATVVMGSTEFRLVSVNALCRTPGGISGLSRKRSPTSRPKCGRGDYRVRSASLTPYVSDSP